MDPREEGSRVEAGIKEDECDIIVYMWVEAAQGRRGVVAEKNKRSADERRWWRKIECHGQQHDKN